MSLGVVIIDTHEDKSLAREALEKTVARCDVSNVYSFSDVPLVQGENFYKIRPIASVLEYSSLILTVIPVCVNEERCLVVQWDGYVVNPGSWSDEFLAYDYIGAPWRNLPESLAVGNGGFSLRSSSLLRAVSRLSASIPAEVPESQVEDVVIGRYLRPMLEGLGLKFAPVTVAEKFSTEDFPVPMPAFGFHGVGLLPYIENEVWILVNLKRIFERVARLDFILKFILCCEARGYVDALREACRITACDQRKYFYLSGILEKRYRFLLE
jgi:hypothetical protein